ncbi:uncharacterized protein LOC144656935 isoform X1 [Oculina patagonica]
MLNKDLDLKYEEIHGNTMTNVICFGVAAILLTILWRKFNGKRTLFRKQYSHDNGRPLGIMEKWCRQGHDTDGFLILANTLVLRSKKPITGPVVRTALELLMKRHPMLRMCTKKDQDGDYRLQKMANVHVDLRELDTTDWKSVMEDSLVEKFDGENGPLWRVTFLPNARYEPDTEDDIPGITSYPHECIIVFGFHHILVDGQSYIRMFAEFIKYLDKLINNEEPEVRSMAMLPPVDLYLEEVIQPKWYHHVMHQVQEMLCIIPGFPEFMMRRMNGGNAFTRKFGVETQRNPYIQSRTKVIPKEFSTDETSRLLKMCKEQQTTVQGAAQTAASVAMVTMLDEHEWEVGTGVTVNIRPFLKSKVPDDYAGMYFFFLHCNNLVVSSPDAEKFWSMARQASRDLHERLNKNEHMKLWPMFTRIFRMEMTAGAAKVKEDRSGQRSDKLLFFTNLGHAKCLNSSPDNDDVILRARFGSSAGHPRGSIFSINIVTFNGKLFLTVIYYSNIVSDATAEKYADLVKGTILKAIKE